MPTLRFPLVWSWTNRNPNAAVSDTKDQQFINCFPEVNANPVTQKRSIVLNKRQGTAASSDVQASATAHFGSIIRSTGVAVFSYIKSTGSSVMFFNSSAIQVGGDVANAGACLFMNTTDISAVENLTATIIDNPGNGFEVWYYPEGGAWTQITDGDFPTALTATHTHMDGYMFAMTTTGRIYNSDLNSLANWGANNYITANSYGDAGVGVARYKNSIVGFGGLSTEFYVNAGNATGSVLRRVPEATLRIGAVATGQSQGASIREVGDSVYWVGRDADTGRKGIYRLNGYKAEKISNAAVDKLLASGRIDYIFGSFSLLGMTHIAFRSGSATSAMCYCVDNGFWWLFTPAGSLTLTALCGDSNAHSYFTTFSNAKIYTFDPDTPVWQDNASAYTMTVQTDNVDCDTDRMKFWDRLRLVYDRQSATSAVSVSWSDDDGANFSTPIDIDTSTAQSWITALGASQRRIWKFTHAANTACRIQAVEIDYTLEPMAVAA